MSDKHNEATPAPGETPRTAVEGSREAATSSAGADADANAADAAGAGQAEKLADLMADAAAAGGARGATKARPDLDADAMAAAQAAIVEGERALAAARAQLGEEHARQRSGGRRELALRALLVVNVLAMIVVVAWPSGSVTRPAEPEIAIRNDTPPTTEPVTPPGPRLADKYNQALVASEAGDYTRAIGLLEEYLADSPRMTPSRRINVYRAIAHYASTIGKLSMAQDYERKAQALAQSHYLPEDLVVTAKAAAENGDQEALRQVWARFLLQQRQIPSSLYQHVAEAYLQLGDSYRLEANAAAEAARLEDLRRTDELLQRQQQQQPQQPPQGKER